ncbi:MAG TPA: TerC family protein [Lacunisphaera sp.]
MTPWLAVASTADLHTPTEWILAVLSIVVIDVVLAGDNAVVIALAVRTLPPKQRLIGSALGAGAAVLLRVVLTFVAARLLSISYIKLVGGLFLLWIAVKLLVDNTGEQEEGRTATGLGQAIWLILVADVTMSLDNVLAVAGASRGSLLLLVFGLALSIPLVVFTSNLLSHLMDRYVILVYLGAAILGKVAGEMIMTDPLIADRFQPPVWVVHVAEAGLALAVILAAMAWQRFTRKDLPPT